jgi:acyl-CoA synthetase (AMP-forming)/AMP-acid ligase II
MTPNTADTWAPHVILYNIYGVTECCVYQALGRVRGAATARSIERGIGRSSLFLIDRETREVFTESDVGAVGELCLGGPQVFHTVKHTPEQLFGQPNRHIQKDIKTLKNLIIRDDRA